MDAPGSALIVPVRLPRTLESFRATHVPSAALGIPAHITLIYPFLPAQPLDAAVRRSLVACFARHGAFSFRAAGVHAWPGVLYLRVDPTEPFEALVATLVSAFPGHPPNSGEFPYVPHVTIAEAPARSMTSLAPPRADVHGRADRILLIAEGADGRWRTRWQFPLRAVGGISA